MRVKPNAPARPSAVVSSTSHLKRSSALVMRRQSGPRSSSAGEPFWEGPPRRSTAGAVSSRSAGSDLGFISRSGEQELYRARFHRAQPAAWHDCYTRKSLPCGAETAVRGKWRASRDLGQEYATGKLIGDGACRGLQQQRVAFASRPAIHLDIPGDSTPALRQIPRGQPFRVRYEQAQTAGEVLRLVGPHRGQRDRLDLMTRDENGIGYRAAALLLPRSAEAQVFPHVAAALGE